MCDTAGRMVLATVVDHVTPISAGGAAFDLDGTQSLCPSCHSKKTARGSEAGGARTTRALQPQKGCDANGRPLDPSHHWNKSLRTEGFKTAPYLKTQLVADDG